MSPGAGAGLGAGLGPVLVVGTGLLGTSVALAARRAGLEVLLSDVETQHLRTASGLGAGRERRAEDRPRLVVVAVPPRLLGRCVGDALDADPTAYVTDVGSIKSAPLVELAGHPGLERYVGSHPMAGSERSGPLGASAALFDGRPWAVTPHLGSAPEAVTAVTALAEACGGVVALLSPTEHDRAVARTSHVPHLMAALAAGRLAEAQQDQLALSGQGVRDVTRVAAGDPALYSQIVTGNATAVLALLDEVRTELDAVITAVGSGDRAGLERVLGRGVEGTRRIPGKHGATIAMRSVWVSVPDHAGELARLFADAGEIGVNIEDVRIDHDPGRAVGLVQIAVASDSAEHLLASLESRGWLTHR